jgi:hypothetical protein
MDKRTERNMRLRRRVFEIIEAGKTGDRVKAGILCARKGKALHPEKQLQHIGIFIAEALQLRLEQYHHSFHHASSGLSRPTRPGPSWPGHAVCLGVIRMILRKESTSL